MLTATLTWDLPTTRKDGSPLAPTEIAKIIVTSSENPSSPIELSGDTVTFTTGDISAQPGEHDYTVVVVDTSDPPLSSVAVAASVIVPVVAVAAPSPVTNLVAVLNSDAAPAPAP